jgi:hypothetical protein
MSSASYCVSSALNFISWSPNAAGGVEDCLCQEPPKLHGIQALMTAVLPVTLRTPLMTIRFLL